VFQTVTGKDEIVFALPDSRKVHAIYQPIAARFAGIKREGSAIFPMSFPDGIARENAIVDRVQNLVDRNESAEELTRATYFKTALTSHSPLATSSKHRSANRSGNTPILQ
jgi:hypothetical protein